MTRKLSFRFAPAFIAPALLAVAAAPVSAKVSVDPDRIVKDVKTLASDTFEGRAPGTTGEERTIGYLIARMQDTGLEPAGPVSCMRAIR